MRKSILVFALLLCLLRPSYGATLWCGKDLDGDGTATGQGETAQCVGNAGTLCPIDAAGCAAATSTPACPAGGTFVPVRDRCEAPARFVCSLDGSTYDALGSCTGACIETVACTGPLSSGLYLCPLNLQFTCDAAHTCSTSGTCTQGACPASYAWDGSFCTAAVQCAQGSYDAQQKLCVDASAPTCPYGAAYPCVADGTTMRCSTITCFDPTSTQIVQSNDSSMLQNDGQRDNLGNCLGDLYIFSGRSMECNTSGQETGWRNCCMSGTAPLADNLGSASSMVGTFNTITNVYHLGQIAYYGNMVSGLGNYGVQMIGSFNVSPEVSSALATVAQTGDITQGLMMYAQAAFLDPTTMAIGAAMYLVEDFLLSGSCTQDDLQTAMLDDSGMCHYIDTYCKKKWPLVGCVQEAKVFCCFNSKLARIIQEQGRPQLATFNPPWVYTGSGNCRGFTPSEFQMLDFSKMDLSEYLGDIKTKAQATLQNTINNKVNQYYQNTQP